MENSDQLFHLIHSLSKSEKRYFKIYSSLQAGNKMYIELFNLIKKQKEYDEQKLKSKLKITAFATAKVYLYNLILKSLRLQNYDDNKKKLVIELLENAENLLKKGLFDQSHKQLMKAKKIAQKFQQFPLLIEIYQMEHIIANRSKNAILQKVLHNQGKKEFDTTIAALNEQFEYRKAINLLACRTNERGRVMRSEKEKEDIEKHIIDLLNRDPNKCLSFKAKTFHYNAGGLYYHSNNNNKEAYNQHKKSILHLNSDADLLTQDISNYIDSISNIINSLMSMGRYKEMMSYIHKTKDLPVKNLTDKARIFSFVASRQITYFIATGQHQKGIELIPELKKQLSIYKDKLNICAFYALCLNIEEICFVNGNYKEALQWNNKVLNHPEVKLHYQFYSNARISEIIIHFELDNFETFQSLVKSYQLFLKKKPFTGKFELACSNFFRLIAKATNQQKYKQTFILFLNQLKELSVNSYETGVFDIFDLQGWLQSKIDGRKFSDIVITNK